MRKPSLNLRVSLWGGWIRAPSFPLKLPSPPHSRDSAGPRPVSLMWGSMWHGAQELGPPFRFILSKKILLAGEAAQHLAGH